MAAFPGARINQGWSKVASVESDPVIVTPPPDPAVTGLVLVVDDEAPVREMLAAILESANLEVHQAASGDSALELVRGPRQYDAILSDVDMPRMSGLRFLQAVRAVDLDVPVLLITGRPEVDSAARAVEHGAFRYLLKPVSMETLTDAVASAMRLHRVARLRRQMLAHLGDDTRLLADHAGLHATFESGLRSLRMVYQPIVRPAGGLVYAFEALARTSEPRLPHPGILFDSAERLNRVHELGRATRGATATFLGRCPVPLAFVYVHPGELSDDEMLAPDAPLSQHAGRVVLEITERHSLEGVPDLALRLKALRALGYRLAIDDLGAGYAGLTAFAVVQPDIVKLDMSLVRGCDAEPIKQQLIRAMTTLCKELRALVVAEGIETAAERDTVTSLGVDLLQGFLVGRPAETEHVLEGRPPPGKAWVWPSPEGVS